MTRIQKIFECGGCPCHCLLKLSTHSGYTQADCISLFSTGLPKWTELKREEVE